MADVDLLRHFGFLHYNVGTIHLAEGRYAAATRSIREAANWYMPNIPEALMTVAQAAVSAGSDAYARHEMTMAVSCCRAARDAAPDLEAVQGMARTVARQAYNFGAEASNSGNATEAADALWVAHELDPELEPAATALPPALRAAAAGCFAEGRPMEGLGFVDRLHRLATGGRQDEGLIRTVTAWLRDNFMAQTRELRVGGAVLLLAPLTRLDAAAPAEPALAQAIVALTDAIAQRATEQPVEVLNAVSALHPLCPSAKLSWAGAAACEAAMTQARRLHVAGELMQAVALCEPATRYRPRGPDRQLAQVLATLLCRSVQESLEPDRAAALALHERVLVLLEACRSPGIAAS